MEIPNMRANISAVAELIKMLMSADDRGSQLGIIHPVAVEANQTL